MASLTNTISVFADGNIQDSKPQVIPPRFIRQPHDTEIVDYNLDNKLLGRVYRGDGLGGGPVRQTVIDYNKGFPEVFRIEPYQSFWITEPWQKLVIEMNPDVSPEKALSPYYKAAFLCNTQDFLCDQMRWCGGAVGEVLEEKNGLLYLKSLYVNGVVPTAAYMDEHPELWYYGTTIVPSGENRYVTRKGYDGKFYPLRIPFISEVPVYIPKSWADPLPVGFWPPGGLWKP